MKEDLIKLTFPLKNKVDFLYNPIDFEKIKLLAEEKFLKSEEILSNQKYCLMIARLDCVPKDFETLFRAYEIAKEKGYDGKLYLIGDGPDKEKVENLRKNSFVSKDIVLLGRKENPYNWLKKADKLILSSKYEGFAMVLLEGLCLEKEVISSNCKTGPKEILNNNRGVLFETGNFKELSRCILNNREKKDLKFSLDEFKRENIFKKFIEILED